MPRGSRIRSSTDRRYPRAERGDLFSRWRLDPGKTSDPVGSNKFQLPERRTFPVSQLATDVGEDLSDRPEMLRIGRTAGRQSVRRQNLSAYYVVDCNLYSDLSRFERPKEPLINS